MKRVIKASVTMDQIAECVADINEIMENYFIDFEGMSKSESHEYFHVVVDKQGTELFDVPKMNDSDVIIVLYAEINYTEFNNIQQDLNSAVNRVDKNAYFEAHSSGVFYSVIHTQDAKTEDEDPIFNRKNVEEAANKAVEAINNSLETDLKLTECEIETGWIQPGIENEDNDIVRIFVTAENKDYECLVYVDVKRSETISAVQMKSDLIDELYTKMINSVVHK